MRLSPRKARLALASRAAVTACATLNAQGVPPAFVAGRWIARHKRKSSSTSEAAALARRKRGASNSKANARQWMLCQSTLPCAARPTAIDSATAAAVPAIRRSDTAWSALPRWSKERRAATSRAMRTRQAAASSTSSPLASVATTATERSVIADTQAACICRFRPEATMRSAAPATLAARCDASTSASGSASCRPGTRQLALGIAPDIRSISPAMETAAESSAGASGARAGTRSIGRALRCWRCGASSASAKARAPNANGTT